VQNFSFCFYETLYILYTYVYNIFIFFVRVCVIEYIFIYFLYFLYFIYLYILYIIYIFYIFCDISIEFLISFNELGIYDLPAMITFITNMRSQPLHTYIGHSMGTTTFYVMASERPEIARMVQMMISLAPTAFVSHMQSPIRFLVPFWKGLKVQ